MDPRFQRAIDLIRHHGLLAFFRRAWTFLRDSVFKNYRRWVALHDTIGPDARRRIAADVACMPSHPVFSLILPVAENCTQINATIASLQSQIFPYWEIFLCVDSSTSSELRLSVADLCRQDCRVHHVSFERADGWAVSTNRALALASGDFIVLLDAGDRLPEHALYWVAREALEHPEAALIYSDEDSIRSNGRRVDPWFKPDWNPALMLSCNAVGRLAAFSRPVVERLGGFREGFEGAEEYELALRCARATDADRIRHIPRVLYHRGAGARIRDAAARLDSGKVGQRAASEHLAAQGITAALHQARGGYQILYALPNPGPRVSVIVATTGRPEIASRCFDSLAARTNYENLEVLVLIQDAHLKRPERARFLSTLEDTRVFRIIQYPDGPFNYSRVNNLGAREASGDVLCFLNDDTEAITPDWLQQLVSRVSLPGVAVAGPMLYYPDGTIQHAGVILGLDDVARHACCYEPHGSYGYFGRARLEQDVSAVTAACMTIRAGVFRAVGGFDEEMPLAYNDVDLCLRVRALKWRIVWTPQAELFHHESASLGRHDAPRHADQHARDAALMRKRWGTVLATDPFYNRNLSLDRLYHPAFPPRIKS